MRKLLVAWLLVCFGSGCGLPHDSEQTSQRIKGGILRVGVLQDDPVAADYVDKLASLMSARVQETRAPAHSLLEGLTKFELDLVYGRLEEKSPLLNEVASSLPYHEEVFRVAGAPAPPTEEEVEQMGLRAAGSQATLQAGLISGRPMQPSSPWLLLAPGQAEPEGYRSRELGKTRRYVLALPPGENRWVMIVDGAVSGKQAQGV